MKKLTILLTALALVVLAACGGKDPAPAGYDPETTSKALLESGAFEQELSRLDADMVSAYLGLEDEPEPEPPEQPQQEEEPLDIRDDNAVLREIRRLNDDIDDEAMSRKIDRIGEITSKIYGYAKQNPGKEDQLRSFLNYYLPTTLKILKAYARMEDEN